MADPETLPDDDGLETVAEVADKLKLSRRQVRRLIASGELPHYRIGKAIRVSRADRLAYLAKCRSE